jgi:putative membrane protein
MIRTYRHTMLMLSALALAACAMSGASSDEMPQQKSGGRAESQTGAPMKTGQPSPEARLLGFLNVANKGDLEGGRLAQERGASMAVKTYGRQMEVHHMQMLEESEAAAKRLGVLPAMGPETQPLVQDHEKTMQRLQGSSGKEFDQLYLLHEIEMHKRVLQTVGSLAGQTREPELIQIVAGAQPILEAHLEAAQRLMAEKQ